MKIFIILKESTKTLLMSSQFLPILLAPRSSSSCFSWATVSLLRISSTCQSWLLGRVKHEASFWGKMVLISTCTNDHGWWVVVAIQYPAKSAAKNETVRQGFGCWLGRHCMATINYHPWSILFLSLAAPPPPKRKKSLTNWASYTQLTYWNAAGKLVGGLAQPSVEGG